jgi:hypothetical protein
MALHAREGRTQTMDLIRLLPLACSISGSHTNRKALEKCLRGALALSVDKAFQLSISQLYLDLFGVIGRIQPNAQADVARRPLPRRAVPRNVTRGRVNVLLHPFRWFVWPILGHLTLLYRCVFLTHAVVARHQPNGRIKDLTTAGRVPLARQMHPLGTLLRRGMHKRKPVADLMLDLVARKIVEPASR